MPEPMTPADCDLRNYASRMPLQGQRFFASDFYNMSLRDLLAGWAGLKLLWEGWQQCPAASLPNDDFALARLADFGADIKGWRAAKAVALHGWVLCSDGRLYHPLLADEAVRNYASRLQSEKRREADRARLATWREARKATKSDAATDGAEIERPPETPSETRVETGVETRFDTASETRVETPNVALEPSLAWPGIREESLATSCTPSPRKAEPASDKSTDRLSVEGVRIFAALTGDRPALAESFLRDVLKAAPRGSETKLMSLLRQAEASPPANPREKLTGWLKERLLPPKPDCPALRDKFPIAKMPRISDPPDRWADFAENGSSEIDKNGVRHFVFAGYYVDVAIPAFCAAAGITDPNYRGDFDVPLAWLRDGFDPDQILSVIKAVVARSPGKAIARLRYFDAAIREQHAHSQP